MFTDEYDTQIRGATETWLTDYDWRLYKAQLIAESSLNSNAVSSAGAKGIAQFMPATWAEVSRELNLSESARPIDPFYAIPAGAYYMNKMINKWTWQRPRIDQVCLAMASYNAGFGNILAAQREAGSPVDYRSIVAALPCITGDKAKDTVNYVFRILETFNVLVTQ